MGLSYNNHSHWEPKSNPNMEHLSTIGDDDNDDFIMLGEPLNLAVRSKTPAAEHKPVIQINPIRTADSFLVSICPPSKPAEDIRHVSCDVVLVIDVSGSMATQAPLPDVEDETERESSRLTVLDLVRHACKTIVSTLNKDDRLALVTFSRDAKVIQDLTSMTEAAKAEVLDKVSQLRDESATNLWAGIRAGLAQFSEHPHVGNVQGLYVLTDGQPNYMCPQQGYVPKLEPILANLTAKNDCAPTIHTFGFGYSIRSDLMLSIAKAGGGNYAFMPDVGMIGTVFVHAVANLYATYATNAILEVTIPGSRTDDLQHDSGLEIARPDPYRLIIKLGNIMFGQSRDLVVSYSPIRVPKKTCVNAKVTCQLHNQSNHLGPSGSSLSVSITSDLGQIPTVPQATLDYHLHRNNFCRFFASLYPVDEAQRQHKTRSLLGVKDVSPSLRLLLEHLVSVPGHDTDLNLISLLSDLVGPQLSPETLESGQIYQALQTSPQQKDSRVFKSYWEKWGRHYLSSLWCAHMRQTCNSFKDAGPLRYGINSELFKRCRDELDEAFDNLPPPVGTYVGASVQTSHTHRRGTQTPTTSYHGSSSSSTVPISMSRWNRSDNTCFLDSCLVTLASGAHIKVEDLRTGMQIYSPQLGLIREVAGIVKAINSETQEICRVGKDLWITPWHPIFSNLTRKWVFPNEIAEQRRFLNPHETVYSIILTPNPDADSHTLEVGGISCVTLGHGITQHNRSHTQTDIRAHAFFGNYRRIAQNLSGLSMDDEGRWLCGGVIRDSLSGLICGVLGASAQVEQIAASEDKVDEDTQRLLSRL